MTTLTTTTNIIDPFQVIDRANLSPNTKKQYRRQVELYLDAGNNLHDAGQLASYASELKSSPKAFLKSAVRLWAKAVTREIKSQANPDNVQAIQATIYRLESLNDAIQVQQPKGKKSHNWLSGSQIRHLKEVVTDTRDYLIISLMLACGLRRNEVISIKREDVTQLGDKSIVRILGKGDKLREIPITDKLAQALKDSPGDGEIIFPLASQTIMDICRRYGKMIDLPELAPHDLRRTFAQTALDNGVSLPQISKLLGHASVQTTMRYLDLDTQNLPIVGDFMAF